MGFNPPGLALCDQYVEQLQDLYSAENQLVAALPKLAQAASHPQFKQAFQTHLAETQQQIERLDQAFAQLSSDSGGTTCKARKGLIEEGQEMSKAAPTRSRRSLQNR